MPADHGKLQASREPFWRDWAMLAFSLATVMWVAFVR